MPTLGRFRFSAPRWFFAPRCRAAPACAAAVVLAQCIAAAAAAPRFDSAYTDLAKDCRPAFAANDIEEGQDMPLRCAGPAGAALAIDFSAQHTFLQVDTADGSARLAQPLRVSDADRGKVEWRMADGAPFAVIVRVRAGEGRAETLEVRGIGAHRALTGSVAVAGRANANALARALADRGHAAGP